MDSERVNMKNISDVTDEDIDTVARELALEHNRVWDELSDEEQADYRTDAIFSFNWIA